MATLIVGHVYTVQVVDGFADMSLVSPLRPIIPQPDAWRVVKAKPHSKRISNLEFHIGIVIKVDPSSNLAVILMGSRHPLQAHRFVPWFGTPGMRHQTRECLIPSPQEVFLKYPGYINFSHALLVKVVGRRDPVTVFATPGPAIVKELTDLVDDLSDVITVPSEGLELCRFLHTKYWEGVRYDDGERAPNGGAAPDGGVAQDGGAPHGRVAPDGQAPSGRVQSVGDVTPNVSHEGGSSPTPDIADRLEALLRREELRIMQLKLVDDECNLSEGKGEIFRQFVKTEALEVRADPLTSTFLNLLEPVNIPLT